MAADGSGSRKAFKRRHICRTLTDRLIARSAPSQLDGLLREEQNLLVRRVLAGLSSDRDRKILYRFYLADDDKDEICADLGVTSLHFNQILFRAREHYKKLFKEMMMQPKKKIARGME